MGLIQFYGLFSDQFYRKLFSVFVIMNMCCDCVDDFLLIATPDKPTVLVFISIISFLIPEAHLTGKLMLD